MPEKEGSAGGERSTSFLDTCKSLFAAITSALHTRLELLVTELEEERERLKQTLLLTLLLFFSLTFGFILLNIFAVALFWEKGWVLALGGLAVLCLGVGVVAALMQWPAVNRSSSIAVLGTERSWPHLAAESTCPLGLGPF